MSAALNAAVRWGMICVSPAAAVKLPKVERREARVLTETEIDWLLSAALSDVYWVRPLLAVSIATGCRRGELLALRWSDVHLDAAPPFISITRSLEQTKVGLRTKTPKNGKPRRCPLPDLAVEALREHLAKQQQFRDSFGDDYRDDLDVVFATPEGAHLKPDSVTAKICLLTKNCKMVSASLHTMRHSHGSQLLSAGVPLPTVSKRLGHSSVNVTAAVYAHAFAADELAAADAWQERFQKLRDQSVTKQPTQQT